ncbi:hypothetical protein Tco_0223447 [Tanacetum coccineum]
MIHQSLFWDLGGGSLAKSFSVVEGKYNLPDLVANCLKSSKNDHKFLVSSQVILSKSLYALSCSLVEPRYGSSSRINWPHLCDVKFCGYLQLTSKSRNMLLEKWMSPIVDIQYFSLFCLEDSHLDITSDHKPWVCCNTSITPLTNKKSTLRTECQATV